jgi:CRISPR/Cas system-associated exonuclease Cas4 (RecB family)
MIGPLSATGLARYEKCPLSEWFRVRRVGSGGRPRQAGPAVRLGRAAHNTLEALIKDSAYPGDWRGLYDMRWTEALDGQAHASEQAGERLGPPESWPDLMTIKLGVRRCLEVFEPTLRPGDEVQSEWEHTTSDGLIYGVADIVVEGHSGDRIVDLKTGQYEFDENQPSLQLLLYAANWEDATGRMPGAVELLLARSGQHIQLNVDEAGAQRARQVAAEAHAVLQSADEPAAIPGEHCRTCPGLGVCETGRSHALEYDDVLCGVAAEVRRNNDGLVTAVSVVQAKQVQPTEVVGLELRLDLEDQWVLIVGFRSTADGRRVARPTTNVTLLID